MDWFVVIMVSLDSLVLVVVLMGVDVRVVSVCWVSVVMWFFVVVCVFIVLMIVCSLCICVLVNWVLIEVCNSLVVKGFDLFVNFIVLVISMVCLFDFRLLLDGLFVMVGLLNMLSMLLCN